MLTISSFSRNISGHGLAHWNAEHWSNSLSLKSISAYWAERKCPFKLRKIILITKLIRLTFVHRFKRIVYFKLSIRLTLITVCPVINITLRCKGKTLKCKNVSVYNMASNRSKINQISIKQATFSRFLSICTTTLYWFTVFTEHYLLFSDKQLLYQFHVYLNDGYSNNKFELPIWLLETIALRWS